MVAPAGVGSYPGENEEKARIEVDIRKLANQDAILEFQKVRYRDLELPQFNHMAQMDKDRFAEEKAVHAWQQSYQLRQLKNEEYIAKQNVRQGDDRMAIDQLFRQREIDLRANLADQQEKHQLKMQQAGFGQEFAMLQKTQDFQGRQQDLDRALKTGELTGSIGGQQTIQAGALVGNINGQQTLQSKELEAKIAQEESRLGLQRGQLMGYMEGAPTLEREATMRRLGVDEAGLTGYFNGSSTLGREKMQQEGALGLMNMAFQAGGPANAFQYARSLSGTPQGFKDIVAATAGEYNLPGFGGASGEPIEVKSAGTVARDIVAGRPTSGPGFDQGGAPPPGPVSSPAFGHGSDLPSFLPPANPQPGMRYASGAPEGVDAPPIIPVGSDAHVSALDAAGNLHPADYAALRAALSGARAPTEDRNGIPSTANMVLPGQLNARNTQKLLPTQKGLLMSGYKDQGRDPADVAAEFNASLPKWNGPSAGRYRMAG